MKILCIDGARPLKGRKALGKSLKNAFLFKIEKLNFVKKNLIFVFIFCYIIEDY